MPFVISSLVLGDDAAVLDDHLELWPAAVDTLAALDLDLVERPNCLDSLNYPPKSNILAIENL